MTPKEYVPSFLARLLADDTAAFLRFGPGPVELDEYYRALLGLVDALEDAVAEVHQVANAAIGEVTVG